MTTTAVTEAYERRLSEELNLLLADAVPTDATPEEAEDAMMRALTVPLTDTPDLYERIKALARTERGFLRDRMGEDNPITAAPRRMTGRRA
jgi:hypothetical protein